MGLIAMGGRVLLICDGCESVLMDRWNAQAL